MRFFIYFLVILALLTLVAAIYVRVAPVVTEDWHVDPETVTAPAVPNYALLVGRQAVRIEATPLVVAGRLDAIAEDEGAQVVAGSAGEGLVTYMVRSRIFGFPDFISVKLGADGDATRVHIFARARFGASDLGVNTARVHRWVTGMRGEEGAE